MTKNFIKNNKNIFYDLKNIKIQNKSKKIIFDIFIIIFKNILISLVIKARN